MFKSLIQTFIWGFREVSSSGLMLYWRVGSRGVRVRGLQPKGVGVFRFEGFRVLV